MKTATTRCGACNVAPGPGTRPGLMVVKRNAPWSSVGMRPKPRKSRSSRFFCWSAGCAYLPCEFACQISTRPSLTPMPSPSSSRPSIATRSPLAPRAAMLRVVSQSSPMWRYGPTVWLPLAYRLMLTPRRRGIAATQHDVEAVGERPFRNGVLPVERRDQANTRFPVGDRVVHRVVLQQRVSRKIHLGDHAREEGGSKQREVNVRRAPGVVVVAPGILARPDADETVTAFGVGHGAPGAGEVRIERCSVLIGAVRIAPGRVRLPDFDQGVRHRLAVLVEHAPAHDNAFADWLAPVLAGEIVVGRLDVAVAEDRAGQLGQRLRRHDERLRRAALLRRGVRRVVVLRLGTRMKTAVARQLAALSRDSLIHWRRLAWKAERGRKPPAACTVRTRASREEKAPDRIGSAWR